MIFGIGFGRWALLLLSAFFTANAICATYPARPMRLIVPFPPGGGVDIVARIIAREMSDSLQQQMVVDNRPGAAGTLGTDLVAKATPDGYTLLLGSVGPLAFSPSLYRKLPYEPKDFAPVSSLVSLPNVLLASPASSLSSVSEVVSRAKANPEKLSYGSAGAGTPPHLAMELFKSSAKLKIVHVPYKGGPPALNDLMGGRIQLMFINILTALPYVNSGRLKALAVTTTARSQVLPDVPTMSEAGNLPGFAANDWFGLLLPAGAPKPIVRTLNTHVANAVGSPAVASRLASQGAEPFTSSPEQFAQFIEAEIRKWGKVIREAAITVN